MADEVLRRVSFADGTTGDVRLSDGRIDAVGDVGQRPDDIEHDLAGHLLLSAAVEPHAHLDKAFLAERVANPSGDLLGAIEAMLAAEALLDVDDIIERAERAARLMARNGFRAVRTHADTTLENGLRSVEALAEVRRRVADVIDVEIVALCSWPITGTAGADQRALLRDALGAGADLVGGCPHLEESGTRDATDTFLGIATDHGVGVDLHTDETLDENVDGLADLAAHVTTSGFELPVTASHCVSLGMQSPARQRETADAVAAAGIAVVALPATNLYLLGRGHPQATPRGLTAVARAARCRRRRPRRRRQPAGSVQPAGARLPLRDGRVDGAGSPPLPCRGVGVGDRSSRHRRRPAGRPHRGARVVATRGDRYGCSGSTGVASASSVCRSTFAPAVTSAGWVCSAMLCDNPPTLGVKIIAAGQMRASIWAS